MPATNRSEARSNVFLTATVAAGRTRRAVRLRNISPNGALIEGADIPLSGSVIELIRGRLAVSGTIAWRDDKFAGLTFNSAIDVGQWVARVGHAGQQQVDRAVDAIRRERDVPEEVSQALSESLAALSSELDDICNQFTSKPEIVKDMGEQLIRLDALSQSLRQISGRRSKT